MIKLDLMSKNGQLTSSCFFYIY